MPSTTAKMDDQQRPIASASALTARGESPTAFDGRCIPPGGVAPPSNIPDILRRRALPAGRLARLGATRDFRHGLLAVDLLYLADIRLPLERANGLQTVSTCHALA